MSLPFCISITFMILIFTSYARSQKQLDNNRDFLIRNVPSKLPDNESSFSSAQKLSTTSRDHHFDFLMFTQLWPISNCIDWEERGHDHTCTLNDNFEWTVHGIWPTKKHTKGPLHCRNDLPFNEKLVSPILKQLEERWLNVRNGTGEYDFWKHEWLKHGTCAVQLKQLDTEFKYFDQGLQWQKMYDLQTILAQEGITPGGQYSPENILYTVGKYLGSTVKQTMVNPAITCRREKGYQNPLIFELIICFDKELNLIHCDDIAGGMYGNCPQDRSYIVYPQNPDLGWTTARYAMILTACFLIFGLCFGAALYRERTHYGPPRNGCCWNKCYMCCGKDDDYVHPFIVDNFDNE